MPMCLIVFAYRRHPDYHLILAANRDETYDRPTLPLAHWQDAPEIVAGRDLISGGTWLGVTRNGRFAAVTNYRVPQVAREQPPSRGLLAANFLQGGEAPHIYLENLRASAARYDGFSLLVGDSRGIYYFSNRENTPRELSPGLYGLSNHLLDTPWPKVQRAKSALRQIMDAENIEPQRILKLLADSERPADDALPDTGIGLQREQLLSPIFVAGERYGTRSSTVLLITHDGCISITECDSLSGSIQSYEWRLESP
jgi:uncharacterized protein with NRDE domain